MENAFSVVLNQCRGRMMMGTAVISTLPKLSVATLAYARSSSANMTFAGMDHRPSTDESYDDMMYKLHRYTDITAKIRYWNQKKYLIRVQHNTMLHHPELVQTPVTTYMVTNIFAGGLLSEWTNIM
jgi:hypothetical protein